MARSDSALTASLASFANRSLKNSRRLRSFRSPRASRAAALTDGCASSCRLPDDGRARGAASPGERFDRAAPHRPERVTLRAGGETRECDRIVLELRQLRRRAHPPNHIVMAQLVEEFVPLLRKGHLLQQDVARVESDEQRPGLRRELEGLLPFANPHLAGRAPGGIDDGHGDGDAEHGDAPGEVLHLGDLEHHDLASRIPLAADVEHRVPRLEQPLVEEPVEVLPGHGLHRPDEVAGVDRLEGVAMEEVLQRRRRTRRLRAAGAACGARAPPSDTCASRTCRRAGRIDRSRSGGRSGSSPRGDTRSACPAD